MFTRVGLYRISMVLVKKEKKMDKIELQTDKRRLIFNGIIITFEALKMLLKETKEKK